MFQLGPRVAHSGGVFLRFPMLPFKSQNENLDDENPDEAKTKNSLERWQSLDTNSQLLWWQ